MAAGDGAAEQSRLAAERVTRLRRELERAERNAHAWSTGAAGEVLVAEKLQALEPYGWLALHDVHWPGRPKANLDHVLVGPGGIVIVDAKHWSGEVRLWEGNIRQNGYSRESEIEGVLQQASAVAALLEPNHRRLVQGWICLVGQPELRGTTTSRITIEGLNTLAEAVASLPAVLDPALVPTIHAHLQQLLGGTTSPRLLTTAQFTTGRFESSDAPAASLRQWRARPAPAPAARTPRKRVPLGRKKRPSIAGALLQFGLILVGLAILINALSTYRPAVTPAPRPSPAVTQTVPTR
ncbi:NERD domain-containing protein [Arthrobacter sp. UKPF54-2]|uniref:nuclease-related domain-containing protein n=1 Tax=Arthrobacter sp. UKPF54-2 TaxID=2600159 RepID=UPI0011B18F2C|nr:nuclease-related domain-containing protein [Arthrobacter sp. UKPF54-2]QDY89104.1 NERD domain-containing protein [Arthrobacter sp. UKPF54-2]